MYTRTELVTALQELADELDRLPTPSEMEAHDNHPSVKWFLSYFGTWNNAVRETGFTPEGPIEETYTETQTQVRTAP